MYKKSHQLEVFYSPFLVL